MNVTLTHPVSGFTGNVNIENGAAVLGFTNGTCSVDLSPTLFEVVTSAGISLVIGTPGPVPPYDANTDAIVASIVAASTSSTSAALKGAYVPRWQANTAYAANDLVINPSGQIAQAKTSFTSGSSYSASNWTVVAGGGGGSTPTRTSVTASTTVAPVAVSNDVLLDILLDANLTLTLSASPAAGSFVAVNMRATQDATGGRTLTITGADWGSAGAPSLSLAGKRDYITAITVDGSTWDCMLVGKGF